MMEIQYREIGEAIGISGTRQEELLGHLYERITGGDAGAFDPFQCMMADDRDPQEETISILRWVLKEPSLSPEERIFLAYQTGAFLPLQSEVDDTDEMTIDEEDQEIRALLLSFLQSEEGQDMFHPIIDDLEGEDDLENEGI